MLIINMVTDFKKNRKRNHSSDFWKWLGGILILVFIVILIIANIRIYKKRQEFLSQLSSLKQQIRDIELRNSQLKQGIEKSNNTDYIEKVAREELDLQKPGEKAVSFIMPKTEEQKNDSAKSNYFQVFWQWIKDKF